jgi:uncharacterized repeat protein (TIGR03837 family)
MPAPSSLCMGKTSVRGQRKGAAKPDKLPARLPTLLSTMSLQRPTWDIFCRVIDNYGDIGVCWRLARQLAIEYPLQVRLWVDDLTPLTQLWPGATMASRQHLEQVDVRQWPTPLRNFEAPADVVIEAFGCDLPDDYLAAMTQRTSPPVWINLEYLSAEPWVESYHQMLSVHPQSGLKKTFFFPGFTAATGGLLCEQDLPVRQREFNAEGRRAFLQQLSVADTGQRLISLFGYENPAIGTLLDTWQQSAQPLTCFIPTGKILTSVNQHLGQSLTVGDRYQHGNLQLAILPFLAQTDYDRLLWLSDVNFVRGEDSFVRAQWAAKPFIWHIYPQEEQAHQAKLGAFLGRYLQTAEPELASAVARLWQAWNNGESCAPAWNACMARYPQWLEHCQRWREELTSSRDLAGKLVQFSQKIL